jgi:CheY-like chemotaxis protein
MERSPETAKRKPAEPVVLVIDHDELVLEFTVQGLNALAYPAIGACDMSSAVEFAERHASLRVVLCDIHLHLHSGPELIRRILSKRPELKVVFMTGSAPNLAFRRQSPAP